MRRTASFFIKREKHFLKKAIAGFNIYAKVKAIKNVLNTDKNALITEKVAGKSFIIKKKSIAAAIVIKQYNAVYRHL